MSRPKKTTLMEDPNVMELFAVLKENGKDTSALTAVLSSVLAMERQLSEAAKGLQTVQRELAAMREERNHPVKVLLEKTAGPLAVKVKGLRARIAAVKDAIAEGCKKAVAAFRSAGVTALNGLAGFLGIKETLLADRKAISGIIKDSRAAVAKIEAAAAQYHTAGRALKNIGRAVRGKEPIPEIKPNGRLAQLLEAPYRSEIAHFSKSLRSVNRALAALDKLEKAAEAERPSVRENMKKSRQRISERKQEAPAKARGRHKEEAI